MIFPLSDTRRAYLALHFCIFLWGFTAILGKVIDMSAFWLVSWRMLFTTLSLIFLPRVLRSVIALPPHVRWQLVGIGCIVSLHWACFYGAIQLANASVALATMATASFFTSIIEPLITRSKFRWYELWLGVAIVPGILLFTHGLQTQQMNGVYVGLLSAILQAIFASCNKLMVSKAPDGRAITVLELGSGCLFLTLGIVAFGYFRDGSLAQVFDEAAKITSSSKAGHICGIMPIAPNWFYLLFLAIACTSLPFVLSLWTLRYVSAFTAALAVNLETVYGVLFAIPFLCENDELSIQFYIGVAVIVSAVILHPLLRRRFEVA